MWGMDEGVYKCGVWMRGFIKCGVGIGRVYKMWVGRFIDVGHRWEGL